MEDAAPVMATVTGIPAVTHAPPAMPPARYELGTEIARGGMGRVVEATDTTLGRLVALKEALATDSESLRRFQREIKITARLEHPSIVPVHDAGAGPNGAPFYVMRKVSGLPLEKLVAGAKTLNERLALVHHIVAAAGAIAHAHERGIVHRDIKPANILVGDLNETIVIDWGLAKVIGETDELTAPGIAPGADTALESINTRVGIVYGTPGFMAPEQLRGNPVDPRCDVYALGATLYHLLSRKPPHHAKTADEMMRAAVNAPPAPIGDLVSGVPPALSTIIDKSLAYDPNHRYQDARALADDLQRFLSGQLVASHHYTTQERLARFARKHRIPLIAIGAAVMALVVGGVIAYVRVVNERDRADESAVSARKDKQIAEDERARAEERADQLTLSRAREIADSNPTLAVAWIKPLAAKALWREVLPIAAAARAAGVAWSLPASRETTSVEMSRDGLQALTAGGDGVVRLYDLVKRTTRTIAETRLPVTARFADDERKIVIWHGTDVMVRDTAGGGDHKIVVAAPVRDLDVIGITAYWTDTKGALWQLDLAGTNPLQIALDEAIRSLTPSPDGRWLALAGESHLLLYDRTQPTLPPFEVWSGVTKDIDWAADGSHFAALVDESAFDVAMNPAPMVVQRLNVGNRSKVASTANRVYTIGPTGVGIVAREGSRTLRPLTGALELFESRDGTIIATTENSVAVISERGDHTLGVPRGRLTRAQASSHSPFVIGALEDRLLVWNLDEVQPRSLATDVASAFFAGRDQVVATSADEVDQLIDLTTGKIHTLRQSTALTRVAYSAAGTASVIVDIAHKAWLIRPGTEPVDLGDHTDLIGFASDHQILLGSETGGSLQLHDVRTGTRIPLVDREPELAGLAWSRASGSSSPAWVAAVFVDGTLWRKNLGKGSDATTKLATLPNGSVLVRADGTVVFAIDKEIRTWLPDGSVAIHAKLPQAVLELADAGPRHALAFTRTLATEDAVGTFRIELDHTNRVTDLEEQFYRTADGVKLSMAAETGVIVEAKQGALEVVDPLVENRRWRLAQSPGVSFGSPQISTDGRWVIAKTPGALLLWSLGVPATQQDTIVWLDRLTNAVSGAGAKSFGWR
ncbi:MAG: WD-repeat protein [Myxococcales bacterium]|nr:WD-repeat protein [Myxococcales bacterium]